MVADVDSVLVSGRESCLFDCKLPSFGMIIMGPVSLIMLSNKCCNYYLMKCMDAPLSFFNLTMVLIIFNISFWVFLLGL